MHNQTSHIRHPTSLYHILNYFMPLFDNTWTLFLDRDGVINIEKQADYINHWDEFVFYQNAEKSVANLSQLFLHTIIVTNQKGVGKGITPLDELTRIHKNMTAAVQKEGGDIHAIYFCADLDATSTHRKPNAGMAFDARNNFPGIDFSKSIMVGNNGSDMKFGRNVGMTTILLTTTVLLETVDASLYDYHFADLETAAAFLQGVVKK